MRRWTKYLLFEKLFSIDQETEVLSRVRERAIIRAVRNFVAIPIWRGCRKQIFTIASLYPLSIRIVGDIITRCGLECAFPKKEEFE
jgi:hypothetical protein